jgi:hypothetical protein
MQHGGVALLLLMLDDRVGQGVRPNTVVFCTQNTTLKNENLSNTFMQFLWYIQKIRSNPGGIGLARVSLEI